MRTSEWTIGIVVVTAVAIIIVRFVLLHRHARTARQRLTESEAELRTVFAAMDEVVLVVDRHGTYLRVPETRATKSYRGDSRLIGRNVGDALPAETAEAVRSAIARSFESGRTTVAEYDVPFRGKVLSFFATVSPLDDESALWVARDITAQKRTRDDLAESEARYRLLFDHTPGAIWLFDTDTMAIVDVNDAAVRQYGYSREEFVRMKSGALRAPEEVGRVEPLLSDPPPGSPTVQLERHLTKDGTPIDVEVRGDPLSLAGRHLRLVIAYDVTERTRLEARLRQSRTMETAGALAGGVAHDFNDILTVVGGYGDLLLDVVPQDGAQRPLVDEILKAAERAAGLTRQLLAFSRESVLKPRVLDVGEFVRIMEPMLSRLAGPEIDFTLRTADAGVRVALDPAMLRETLVNLVDNARDAMPGGGRLIVETGEITLTEAYVAHHPEARKGRHAMIAVTDTGIGMDARTQSRMFEPFFTTKTPGHAAGMGLSAVLGVVEQSGGRVSVNSELAQGTTVRIYVPEFVGEVSNPVAEPSVADALPTAATRVLVVEDDDVVRRVSRAMLERAGHAVREANNGADALDMVRTAPFDVVVTDTVMPRMGGVELAARLATERPDLPVILTSGYTAEALERHGPISDLVRFIEKPYKAEALEAAIRSALRH